MSNKDACIISARKECNFQVYMFQPSQEFLNIWVRYRAPVIKNVSNKDACIISARKECNFQVYMFQPSQEFFCQIKISIVQNGPVQWYQWGFISIFSTSIE